MFARFLTAVSLLSLMIGQIPRTATLCLCTGEVGLTAVKETDRCRDHALSKCGNCLPKGRSGCFVKTSDTLPPALTVPPVGFECPFATAPLAAAPDVVEHVGVSVHIRPVLPRIREPDCNGHLLRAPPFFV